MQNKVEIISLNKLPIELLLKIYQYLSPEEIPALALIDKRHAHYVSNPLWSEKFEIHFEYLLNELSEEENRNWHITFKKVYAQEYKGLSKPQRVWFSLVKEGKPAQLKNLSIDDLYPLIDAKGTSLTSWAKRKNYQYVLDHFWNKVAIPFFLPNLYSKKDSWERSILHCAALLNQKESVEALVISGEIEVDIKGLSNDTPLHYAAQEGHGDMVQLLLKNKANIDARSEPGATALLFAIENNHPEVVKILLENNADTSLPLVESTPYHTEFKVEKRDTPLHAAIQLGRKDIVEPLLNAKADTNALGSSRKTPLHCAAREGHADMVQLLLGNGANIDARSKAGATALLFAIEHNHPAVVKILLENNANTSIPLDASAPYHTEFKVEKRDTPLHAAIQLGRIDIVKQLLDAKANANALALANHTPLHYAAEVGHADMVQLLIGNGADIDARSKAGATALLFAIENNHPAVVKILLKNNADTSLLLGEPTSYHTAFKIQRGDTPLHAAVTLGRIDIVKQLLNAKANKEALLAAAQSIASEGQGSYIEERAKKWGSFFRRRDARTEQLAALASLDEDSSGEHIAETFINIYKAIDQEYHFGGSSTLAELVNQTLNKVVVGNDASLSPIIQNF